MLQRTFTRGDRIVHLDKPEWGVGVVSKTETATHTGAVVQIVTARFQDAGVKSLSTNYARLQLEADASPAPLTTQPVGDDGPGATIEQGMLTDRMLTLPDETRDPFLPIEKRIAATIKLYRFDSSPRSLIDWGVAQSRLADPLSAFARHELEQLFERWRRERDNRLGVLLDQLRREDPARAASITQDLSAEAARAVQRRHARR
ncbi:MAG: DUF3553 domain-containing protein [Phycisphaerales bacterium]|nr:DUF3553 domain-containing protein [Phycisphaerales bacterium]